MLRQNIKFISKRLSVENSYRNLQYFVKVKCTKSLKCKYILTPVIICAKNRVSDLVNLQWKILRKIPKSPECPYVRQNIK